MAAFKMYYFGQKVQRKRAAPRKLMRGKLLHGHSGHPLYKTWINMLYRCNDKSAASYENYGGRGIFVCDRWQKSFTDFISDMGDRPPGASIDRIDNDGPYSPENCRWATHYQQHTNTRTNHRVDYEGHSLCLSEWSRKSGISGNVIWARLSAGWSVSDAVTKKPRGTRGVSFSPRGSKWLARILINGKRKSAAFPTKEEGLKWGMAILNGEDNGVDTETQ